MANFNDFRQILVELTGKRVKIGFHTPEADKYLSLIGRILSLDEPRKCLVMEPDKEYYLDDAPMIKTYFNLDDVIIYSVDEIPEDADLTPVEDKKEGKFPKGTRVKSVDINDTDEFVAEGWIIHDLYAKTATLTLPPPPPSIGDEE